LTLEQLRATGDGCRFLHTYEILRGGFLDPAD
jgi:hypothetical protein